MKSDSIDSIYTKPHISNTVLLMTYELCAMGTVNRAPIRNMTRMNLDEIDRSRLPPRRLHQAPLIVHTLPIFSLFLRDCHVLHFLRT